MIKCTRNEETWCVLGGNLPYFYGVNSVWMACIDHCPLPHAESFNCLNWLGGGTEREVQGEDCQGGGGRVGGGKGIGAIVSETYGHRGGQEENGESACSAEWSRIAKG